jgi:uncharacterized delta-60 repeat protein
MKTNLPRIVSNCFSFLCVLLILTSLKVSGETIVDAGFNPRIDTLNSRTADISTIVFQPDGKALIAGDFTRYNNQAVGGLARINPDGSLDSSFNNNLILAGTSPNGINIYPDGRILLKGSFTLTDGRVFDNALVRLSPNGNFEGIIPLSGTISKIKIDQSNRVWISGNFPITVNGTTIYRKIVRFNPDNTLDETFSNTTNLINNFDIQNGKLVFSEGYVLKRLNTDGSLDGSFTQTYTGNYQVNQIKIQSDGKILLLSSRFLKRFSENGEPDVSFTETDTVNDDTKSIKLLPNGKIVMIVHIGTSLNFKIYRLLESGIHDQTFNEYNYLHLLSGADVHSDGSVLMGNLNFEPLNYFIRLLPSGNVDTNFNSGGSGFRYVVPGKIRAIQSLPNQKILIGGEFDTVNGIQRPRIALLNADGTIDPTFSVRVGSSGDNFSSISSIYNIIRQSDGKFIVSGDFTYTVGGTVKNNIVRLNDDGSIDANFILSLYVPNYVSAWGGGTNKAVIMPDGKIRIGTTRLNEPVIPPLGLTATGNVDTSFSASLYSNEATVIVRDILVQPDGKIVIAGRHDTAIGITDTLRTGFIARLLPTGGVDTSFQITETINEDYYSIVLLDNGKILASHSSAINNSSQIGKIVRLLPNGSIDSSFNISEADGRINVIAKLPSGNIAAGGLFTNVAGQSRRNLCFLDAEGNLISTTININREVLCMTVDTAGNLLLGGDFTSINDGNQSVNRSYVARISGTNSVTRRAPFDFDGDGKTDISIFRPSTGEWWLNRSLSGQTVAAQFGLGSDKPVPADYTDDGKTDIAFFRPLTGEWFILRSEDSSFVSFPFGTNGDVPVVGDFDADGKSDVGVFRPSTNEWFISKSSGGTSIITFGTAGDVPVAADYDGDGKADIAIYRPSLGQWWISRSSNNSVYAFQFGTSTDKPVQGDYTGDGKVDSAFFRPSTGEWFILRSEDSSFYSVPFGTSGDLPAPGDYDGDGKFDAGVFRPSSSTWYVNRSTAGILIAGFGTNGDKPLPNVFVP